MWFFQDHLIPFKTIAFLCILVYKSNIFGTISMQLKPNKSKHAKIQIFKFHCVNCAYCAPVWANLTVLKTHSKRDNSNNTIGRQFKFTSEVTLLGPHIVSNVQPNPTIIGKVIHHFVHGSFFQDHPRQVPPCVIASKSTHTSIPFKTILVLSRPFSI